jgi:hypothetical protein
MSQRVSEKDRFFGTISNKCRLEDNNERNFKENRWEDMHQIKVAAIGSRGGLLRTW